MYISNKATMIFFMFYTNVVLKKLINVDLLFPLPPPTAHLPLNNGCYIYLPKVTWSKAISDSSLNKQKLNYIFQILIFLLCLTLKFYLVRFLLMLQKALNPFLDYPVKKENLNSGENCCTISLILFYSFFQRHFKLLIADIPFNHLNKMLFN